jgi:4-hydroxy-2-oxoglutarate aldolase
MPALVTPFDTAGEIDRGSHRHNLSLLAERGVEGFLIAGSTGEGPYLEEGERLLLLEAARQELGPEPALLCGIAAETQRAASRQLEEAARGGADAALVMTPTTLIRGDHDALADHYQTLAEASPLPVMIYSVPPYTAYEPPVQTVLELARHPNIVGMKDSGGDPVRLGRIVAGTPEGFALFNGSTSAALGAMAEGVYGAITSSTNYIPELIRKLIEEPENALLLHRRLRPLVDLVEAHGIPGVKAAALAAGLRPGACRKPLRPVATDLADRIADLLSSL